MFFDWDKAVLTERARQIIHEAAANPPSVGEPETIRLRTALYFSMIIISVIGMILALMMRHRLIARLGAWNASLIAVAIYVAVVVVASIALPGVNEVPEQFPAVVLWQFRVASMGAQVILWTTLGLGMGALSERASLGLRNRGLLSAL